MREIVFVLDRSGSMSGLESDVIGGYNSLINEQKKEKGEANVTTVLFDDHYDIISNGVNVKKIERLTNKQYWARGSTALLDAIGKTIKLIDARVEADDKVLFIINTDGKENSSFEFSTKDVFEMITHLRDEHNWEFVFLGANMDSFAVSRDLGIAYADNWVPTSAGINAVYTATSNLTRGWRNSATGDIDEEQLKTSN